ncbi:MAG: hypothetical protein ACKV0T_25380, partial [Planctomycetales bacterium]
MTPKARQTRRATSRFCLLLIPLLIGGIGWLWQRPARSAHDSHSVRVADPISPTGADGYFAADIAGPVTCLELSTGDSSDCDLIIGALGESETRFSVRLSGVQDASPRCSRWNKVTSLTWRTLEPRSRVEWPANARGMKELPVVQLSALSGIPVGDIRTQASRAFPPIGDSNDTAENTLQERSFFLHVTDTPLEDQRGYVSVRATLVGEGDQVRVYRDLQVTPGE